MLISSISKVFEFDYTGFERPATEELSDRRGNYSHSIRILWEVLAFLSSQVVPMPYVPRRDENDNQFAEVIQYLVSPCTYLDFAQRKLFNLEVVSPS